MNVADLRPVRTCRYCRCQNYNHKAISYLARIAVMRQAMARANAKHTAVAHSAQMHSGHFSRLLNGRRPLTNKTWPMIKRALQEHQIITLNAVQSYDK